MDKYAGHYVSTCEALGTQINLDQGGMVYARMASTVLPNSATTARYTFRVDFFADPQCAANALGSLTNDNPQNTVTWVGSSTLDGTLVDRVRFDIRGSADAQQPGLTPDTVVIGDAIRLALPSLLVNGFSLNDLWRLEGAWLYEGGLDVAADGFPTGLNYALPASKVTTSPAAPPAPCAAQNVSWTGSGVQCFARARANVSGSVWNLEDREDNVMGNAAFACSNGRWIEQAASSCQDTAPPPAPKCPAQVWTWTVNGQTCRGISSEAVQDAFSHIYNDASANFGHKLVMCRLTSGGALEWSELHPNGIRYESCDPLPVPPPPATEPLEILQRANCVVCHAQTGTGSVGPSFAAIADFYRGNPPAPGLLEQRIRQGSAGVFGPTPMPANPQISDDQLQIIVPWILSR
ncbi:c-type cytochrome [Hydrogenophaga sp.]|uniref:c-type cytochrome n=1 Tax=Hydrogenophaga sp. TaxID=1904254 RepID=UPI003F6FC055